MTQSSRENVFGVVVWYWLGFTVRVSGTSCEAKSQELNCGLFFHSFLHVATLIWILAPVSGLYSGDIWGGKHPLLYCFSNVQTSFPTTSKLAALVDVFLVFSCTFFDFMLSFFFFFFCFPGRRRYKSSLLSFLDTSGLKFSSAYLQSFRVL